MRRKGSNGPSTIYSLAILILCAAPSRSEIIVCVKHSISEGDVRYAERLGSKIFATADVSVGWGTWDRCPEGGIRVLLLSSPFGTIDAYARNPKVLGYASPREDATFSSDPRVVIYQDRIHEFSGQDNFPYLLAHVLTHELTHILEGSFQHSMYGIMKPYFTHEDVSAMRFRHMRFTDEDVAMIRSVMKLHKQ